MSDFRVWDIPLNKEKIPPIIGFFSSPIISHYGQQRSDGLKPEFTKAYGWL
jgi:hypothetical protein